MLSSILRRCFLTVSWKRWSLTSCMTTHLTWWPCCLYLGLNLSTLDVISLLCNEFPDSDVLPTCRKKEWNREAAFSWIPVLAAIAVRKKVISIGNFSASFCLQSLQFFFHLLLDQIKSNCIYWLHWKTEPNELDELKYSKSLNQTTSYAHWHALLYLQAHIITFIYIPLKIRKNDKAKWA